MKLLVLATPLGCVLDLHRFILFFLKFFDLNFSQINRKNPGENSHQKYNGRGNGNASDIIAKNFARKIIKSRSAFNGNLEPLGN